MLTEDLDIYDKNLNPFFVLVVFHTDIYSIC
jgi:hypothetical protein